MEGNYIYGVIADGNETALDIPGLGGSGSVYTIAYQGLSFALSDYPGREFGSMPKEEVVRCLLAHQVVLEHIMREHTVLPVKFGTILATSEEVRGLLSQGYQQFADALAWIQDKVEVEVAATWDTGQVLGEISTEPEIAQARESIASRLAQILEDRVRLGQMVKVSLDQRRDSYRERMIDFLKPAAVDVQPNVLVSEAMVMNVAFLVEKARQEEFDSGVRQLNDLFQNQIEFRIIGPLPPYSFATLEVTRPGPSLIEEARQLLGLGPLFFEPQVRKAYRRLAAQTHPDRQPGEEANKRFIRLRQAADLLIVYCRGGVGLDGFLIDIKRSGGDGAQHRRPSPRGV